MFINSLKYPYKYKINPNEEEDLDRLTFELIQDNINKLLDKAYEADIKGKSDCALKYYKAINLYFTIIEFVKIIKRYVDRNGTINEGCISQDGYDTFKIKCILDNFPCKNKIYEQDYITFFNTISSIAGVNFKATECEECCVGVGSMIIEGDRECTANIIGDATCISGETPVITPPYGAFEIGGFVINGFQEEIIT